MLPVLSESHKTFMIQSVGKLNTIVSFICCYNNSFHLKVFHNMGLIPSSQNRDLPV